MNRKDHAVAIWLIVGVVMIILQTCLGGITRLTGSGLSITEWKPIMGTIPPMNDGAWNKAFEAYKQIGQYKLVNSSFSLADFKSIFFWEWFHRLWARLLAVVFIVGFVGFLLKGYLNKKMILPFCILFLLGGFQGLIGWLMVKTGLNTEDIHVHYLALSVHFIAAMVLACFILWFALKLLVPESDRTTSFGLYFFTFSIILLTFLQLTYGSFMAGLKAAIAAPTWPSINGFYFPSTLYTNGFVKDGDIGALQLNIHFIHRNIAYLLTLLIVICFFVVAKNKALSDNYLAQKMKWLPLVAVIVQVALGVFALLFSPMIIHGKFGIFESVAELHQLTAMCLLMLLVVNLYLVRLK